MDNFKSKRNPGKDSEIVLVLYSKSIGYVSAGSLGSSQNLYYLSATQTVIAGDRIVDENPRELSIFESTRIVISTIQSLTESILSSQKSLLFLIGEHNVLRNKNMFRNIHNQLGLGKLLQNILGCHSRHNLSTR